MSILQHPIQGSIVVVDYEDTEIPWGEYGEVYCPVRTYDIERGN